MGNQKILFKVIKKGIDRDKTSVKVPSVLKNVSTFEMQFGMKMPLQFRERAEGKRNECKYK
tara:strand:+ start:647 stop:829 length:183 start_codon:yes stop_codon:yes gene_type:complete